MQNLGRVLIKHGSEALVEPYLVGIWTSIFGLVEM